MLTNSQVTPGVFLTKKTQKKLSSIKKKLYSPNTNKICTPKRGEGGQNKHSGAYKKIPAPSSAPAPVPLLYCSIFAEPQMKT